MEDIRFLDPCRKTKLDNDFNSSKPENQRWVGNEVAKTQVVLQQQLMGSFLSRMWHWPLTHSLFSLERKDSSLVLWPWLWLLLDHATPCKMSNFTKLMRFTCYGTSHGGTSHIKANLSPSMVWFKDELGESGGYVTPLMNHPRKRGM
ncbi:hypothetical protein JHK84_052499 [Glycine max]|nr:hypothetical protein JHK84_052499 [Glycine max]